ncbi:ABC transporter ATP-binding protein [Yaniella flava]|uniref:ABC transporter ATP-binding protein n=1 Tax=Yaniella flava TaxID=287930 RepID=A0ABN2TZZ9_9MICC
MDNTLTISGLTRRFGKVVANDDISLRIRPGEVVGLLGHNGAGKTTLVSQLVGLLRPDAGSIHLGDIDAVAHPAAARRQVAVQSQSQAPIDGLTPRAAIEIACRLRGLSAAESKMTTKAIAEELNIEGYLDRRALPEGGGLSGGIRRLTSFAMAAAAPTPLLVLDEPTNDVDAGRRRFLWNAVRRRADEGAGVLLVTHNVTEAERIVDDLVILDRGKVVASGSPAQLRGTEDHDVRLELHLPFADADPLASETPAAGIPPVRSQARRGRHLILRLASEYAGQAVVWANALRATEQITGYGLAPTSLEDAYLAYTSATHNTYSSSEQGDVHV